MSSAAAAAGAREAIDLAAVDRIVAETGPDAERIIPLLRALQEAYGYLPQPALERLCELTAITPAQVESVSTFYSQFRRRPAGAHTIQVCVGTACHIKGAERVLEAFREHLAIGPEEDTDAARRFTVQRVACLGCCTLAPVVQIDEVTYGHVTPARVGEVVEDFLAVARRGSGAAAEAPGASGAAPVEVRIGLGSCCVARGSGAVWSAMADSLADARAPARLRRVGCVGMCHQTPLVEIAPAAGPATLYAQVTPEEVPGIVAAHFPAPSPWRRLRRGAARLLDGLLDDQAPGGAERHLITPRDPQVASFLELQEHLATEHGGELDPADLEEYRRRDGFAALQRCLAERNPEEVLAEVRTAGLRGRGGAGYPTAEKWARVRAAAAAGATPIVIANGDEGDPGAFMDRMLLESFPYRIIEGLLLAAYAVGAREGRLYIRHEYPLAVERVEAALRRCREEGLLGERILGHGFAFDLEVHEGAGAFVCGEETALIAALEGRRGQPRYRPPYPSARGLHGRPTLVNNVETLALVPWILRRGGGAFAALGTERSSGTKTFALAGKVRRGGLVEVPMGLPLRRIVEEIGGGTAGDRPWKAVQVGGPSGGCVPAALGETPVDYEALTAAGAIMGSGGLVVLDEADCMVEVARYFMAFTQDQSCGKCPACRLGTRRMLEILDRLCTGEGGPDAVAELERLARRVQESSLCGLGRTAPNPVLSTLRHFRAEYEAHARGECPARRCRALVTYRITEECIGCTRCAQRCPADAIAFAPYRRHEIDPERCTRCDTCRSVCPVDAVVVEDRR